MGLLCLDSDQGQRLPSSSILCCFHLLCCPWFVLPARFIPLALRSLLSACLATYPTVSSLGCLLLIFMFRVAQVATLLLCCSICAHYVLSCILSSACHLLCVFHSFFWLSCPFCSLAALPVPCIPPPSHGECTSL